MRKRDWESTFRLWSKPSSDTEQEKCENAERMIREALDESEALAGRTIEVIPQGSYRNNTNVRLDSDVDVCVRCMDPFFPNYSMASGVSAESLGNVPSEYTYAQFKNEVEAALVAKFGRKGVSRGKKAFDVHANSYRVDADVVATFEHRRYTHQDEYGGWNYISGTEFMPDDGGRVVNWPHQHHRNGVGKNRLTGNRFKYLTRVLKRLRNEMHENEIAAAAPIPSYLIECLVWNVPNDNFGHEEYVRDMRHILAHTYNATLTSDSCKEWGEVSELKYLFRSSQPWTREQAHAFLDAAWNYIGLD
ncbi:hypothetical protein BHS09_22215 [Myxococcus xanthus]|uniref:cGAS/DncV-like nucleotidyltransferase C-terminal helical domain-containing protein n=1 Tax=Myxococcus xanthus TaxID=34 RepID=A0AAE6G854_MYXXA|nr:hypothetical protein BHS09_22215 [Myxococcus xanthus]QDE79837.1 hypothetical protein BHS08_22230 [Myxococcus xanthus]